MSTSIIPLSYTVNVNVFAEPALPVAPNINTCAIITQDPIPATWASGQAFGQYVTAQSVAADFGINSNTYAIANAIFSQKPNLLFGGGQLVVIPRLQSPSLESVVACLERAQSLVYFFGFIIDQELTVSAPSTFSAIAQYAQANNLMWFYTSSQINDLNPGSPFDLLRQAAENQTIYSYYGSPLLNGSGAQQTQIFSGSFAGRFMSVNFEAPNSTLTMNLKQLTGILQDNTLPITALDAANTVGANVYANMSSFPCLLTSGANGWSDQIFNQFWLKFQLQTDGFDYLAGIPTKVPFTDAGVKSVMNVLGTTMQQAVFNGFLAPGQWPNTAPTFGNPALLLSQVAKNGYYLFAPKVSTLTQAQKQSKIAPVISIAALTAGSIQGITIGVYVQL